MSDETPRDDFAPAQLLSFTGGYVDTFGFVTLFGLFTAHVTGNFVLIGAVLAGHGHGILGKLLALPTFVLAVAATRAWQRVRERRGRDSAVALLAVQLVGLGAFMAAGLAAAPIADPDEFEAIAVGLLGVATMAIQNAAARSTFVKLSPSTVMTGNVTQVTMDLVDLFQGDALPEVARLRVAKLWPPIVAFAAGATAAGLLARHLGFWALLVPMLALLALAVRLRSASSSTP